MSTAALICDAGALLDCLVATAPDHRAFREVIDSLANPLRPGAGTGGGRLLSSKGTGGNDRFDSTSRGEPLPMLPPPWHNWTAPWTSIASTPTFVWALWMRPWLRWQKNLGCTVWLPATSVTSARLGCAALAASSW